MLINPGRMKLRLCFSNNKILLKPSLEFDSPLMIVEHKILVVHVEWFRKNTEIYDCRSCKLNYVKIIMKIIITFILKNKIPGCASKVELIKYSVGPDFNHRELH